MTKALGFLQPSALLVKKIRSVFHPQTGEGGIFPFVFPAACTSEKHLAAHSVKAELRRVNGPSPSTQKSVNTFLRISRAWRRRGKRRSAACGGYSEPLSRKGPGWRARTVPASRLGPTVGKLLCPLGTGIFRSAERVPLPAAAKEPKRCLGALPLRTRGTGWRPLGIAK